MTASLRAGLLISGVLHAAVAAAVSLSAPRDAAPADDGEPIMLRLAVFQPPEPATEPVPAAPSPMRTEPEPKPEPEPQIAQAPPSAEPPPAAPAEPVVEAPPPARRPKAEVAPQTAVTPQPVAAAPGRAVPKPSAQRQPRPKRKAAPAVARPPERAVSAEQAARPGMATRAAETEAEVAPQVDPEATQHYLAALAARINRGKFYPRLARRLGEEGRAVVGFVIQRDGTLTDLRIVESSGHRRLDEAALETVRRVAPVEPIPDVIGRAQWPISVPIAFSLRQ